MSAIGTITSYDDTLNVTQNDYLPRGIQSGIASWFVAGNTSAGDRVLTQSYSDATQNRKTDRVQLRLAIPKEIDNGDGTFTVTSIARVNVDVVIPDDWTPLERHLIYANLQNLMVGSSPFSAALQSGERVY